MKNKFTNKLQNKFKGARGFTLLELVIVIAIIGILAVIILPNMIQALGKARDAKKMTELRGIQTFLTVTGIDTSLRYPENQVDLVTMYGATKNKAPTNLSNNNPTNLSTNIIYNYVGIDCTNVNISVGTFTDTVSCSGYQLWTELEQKTPALDLDSDVVTSDCTNYGATSCPAASTGFMDGAAPATTESCSNTTITDRNCVFDLAP